MSFGNKSDPHLLSQNVTQNSSQEHEKKNNQNFLVHTLYINEALKLKLNFLRIKIEIQSRSFNLK